MLQVLLILLAAVPGKTPTPPQTSTSMGAKHNLPSLENAVMDSPDRENFDGGVVGVGGVGGVGK